MYIPFHFDLGGTPAAQDFVRANVFGTFAAVIEGHIRFAYVPTVFDSAYGEFGSVRFHVARANPFANVKGGDRVSVSFLGPHAYISPDWYETKGSVPTWNYLAAEGVGVVKRLSAGDLLDHAKELAAQEERLLELKIPWTVSNVGPERIETLHNAIVGFHLVFETLEGKAKLSQNRSRTDIEGVIAGLERRGDAVSRAVAEAMKVYSLRAKA